MWSLKDRAEPLLFLYEKGFKMKVKDLVKAIDEFAPFSLAYSWDNSGLLVGDGEQNVNRVFITLDTDINTVREAILNNCDTIVSHHPIFFSALKHIDCSSAEGKMVELLIKHDISVIAAHTNMDCAEYGINYKLAKMLNLNDIAVLEPNSNNIKCGLGRTGVLEKPVTLYDFIQKIKTALGVDMLRFSGDADSIIYKAAVAGGSCSEVIPLAKAQGCDVIVTGDMKYHETIDNVNNGIAIVDPGHYGTEHHVIDIFEKIIAPLGVKIIKSHNSDIFKFM